MVFRVLVIVFYLAARQKFSVLLLWLFATVTFLHHNLFTVHLFLFFLCVLKLG